MSRNKAVAAVGILLLAGAIPMAVWGVENVGGLFAIGTSARAQGMGGAFCALADDEGAVFYNPAGLSWQHGIGLSSLFVQQFGGVAYGTVTVAVPYAGFSVSFLDSGPIPTNDGSVRYASQGVAGSIGVPVGPLGLGVRWRFFRLSSPSSGQGWAVDPAILVVTESVRIGLMVEGLFSAPVTYESREEEAFGRSLRIGAALLLEPTRSVLWNATFEASGLFSALAKLAVGLETWIGGLGARVGFDGRGPTFGLSIRFDTLEIDWAYASRSDLGDSHRVALSLRF